ncbi:diacylglycerol kinase (ATP) [Breznakia sp. PF5-3]|uniref:diacylglycerol/lipid kinase family protein n=1 Tax=unclassified Breznakia TaxID=2623764 RepID=UPI002405B947|nr:MULTISPECIES: diacylglycerol kinase family protein [unclassified Breznakia]MDF9824870.1 diacylglycerol kinase (ATP) [Breznakia sp. PM6-1]MDF9835727.1 diacylglycerol kinase (ATP) [Breznakia sp. PF5-3]MDF9838895.1 diacylglycerol kinase (ATP) [Breznakia sp. PFB2-8]MDF9860921.1 diacylglycerol kinase (ATP) [Breznakia sp. PH5-24]
MKHVFIINPIAGKRNQSVALSGEIKKVFKDCEYYIELTKQEHHATEIAKQYASEGEDVRFYACGGDGTLHEVLNGMYEYPNASLAIIPIGTGNDFIKYFDAYTHEDFLDLKAIKDGYLMKSDLLKCNKRVCMNIASVGFDAQVVQKVAKFKRVPFVNGKMAYLLAVFNSFFSSMKFKHSLQIDDEYIPEQNYIFVVAANGRYYGGGFNPTPDATIDDGCMDVLTITSLPRYRVMGLISTYKAGEHMKYDFAYHRQCKKIKIIGEKAVALNMDGETTLEKDPEIYVIPKALNLILPKK